MKLKEPKPAFSISENLLRASTIVNKDDINRPRCLATLPNNIDDLVEAFRLQEAESLLK